jgi:hypothetical protein
MSHAESYTPALADLMEHEKVIEQGLATFIDVGHALMAIRDGKKYRAAGYATFEDYCRGRWDFDRTYAHRLMSAAEVAGLLPTGNIEPQTERQLRPLAPLKAQPDEARAAWQEAVEEAGGEQPTAKQVERAVAKRIPSKKEHPAPFSDPILDAVASQLTEAGATGTVLDPFAGTGRVHELRDRVDAIMTVGVEIEPEWAAKHPDTIEGNALELTKTIAPESVDAIVTSPTYGNRMADHHDAKDDSVRLTYKHSLGRDLHDDNSGQLQWGEEYRAFHEQAWAEAVAALKPGGTLTLNIKNHVRDGEQQRVVEWHIDTLYGLGLHLIELDIVATKGLMAGANAEKRTLAEFVATFRKEDR